MGIGIHSTPLSARQQEDYLKLLEACGLRDEGDADIVALMTEDDRLIACGALAGHTVKQLAVDSEAEGQGAMAAVLSALIAEAYASGVHRLFRSCSKPGRTDSAAFWHPYLSMRVYAVLLSATVIRSRSDTVTSLNMPRRTAMNCMSSLCRKRARCSAPKSGST